MGAGEAAEVRGRRLLAHGLPASAAFVCVVLYFWPPTRMSFYPACPIHQLLGFDCPGCGATRALAALLHGHLMQALRLNALFVLMLPVGLAGAVECYRRALRPGIFRWPQLPAPAFYAMVGATTIFTVARNLWH